jgi:hypothetical protein
MRCQPRRATAIVHATLVLHYGEAHPYTGEGLTDNFSNPDCAQCHTIHKLHSYLK